MKKLFVLFFCTILANAADIDQHLATYISQNDPTQLNVWIFFKDKGPVKDLSFEKASQIISNRALQRRAKIDGQPLIKFSDYPVYQPYKDQIINNVIRIKHDSRWLNGLSAVIYPEQIENLQRFEFIKEIRLVAVGKRKRPDDSIPALSKQSEITEDLNYGESALQLEQIGVTALHDKGLSGDGVVIAMLDDGFRRYKTHRAFRSLNVLDTYDFINDDTSVDEVTYPNEGSHGTYTLSMIAAFVPDTMIGSAYNAAYLLAKTEIDNEEIRQEEDNWVAGLEWAEANGADIVSSSLGYIDWYDWQDMDGKTAVTTRATITAEQNGLIVVNSAGNEGLDGTPNTLFAPADGEFVITVGGVNRVGNYAETLSFASSYGPTVDGRIKPDVCALGLGVFRASYFNDTNFLPGGSGTSYAAPLVAGAIALLLEAFPDLTPEQVRQAIRKTASQSGNPDNKLGYGILNIEAAYNYIQGDSSTVTGNVVLRQNRPNPFNRSTRIEYVVKNRSRVKLTIFDVLGRKVLEFPERLAEGSQSEFLINDQLGASGVYFYMIEGKDLETGKHFTEYRKMLLIKNKNSY